MAKTGNAPEVIMNFLEQQRPEVADHAIWKALKGKSAKEIEEYAGNLVGSLGLFK